MDKKIGPDHYRYFTTMDERGVFIHCQRFIAVGETPHFYYVVSETTHRFAKCLSEASRQLHIKKNRKRVSKDGWRRHCYPDKNQALKSLVERQRHRIHHAKLNLSAGSLAMAEAERMLEAGHIPGDGGHPCGSDEYIESLAWE
ncbi:MAG: hypothetical protein GX071_10340 [Gammaproteobacteria bacterium]|nr:hypothetical protein [Gammaproteobacteria bacterium]